MSAGAVRTAFRDRLAAEILAGRVSVPFLETINKSHTQTGLPEAWCTLQFFGTGEEQVSLGQEGERLFRERGTVLAHAHSRSGSGDSAAVSAADEIRAAFRAWHSGGIVVEAVSPPETGDGDDVGAFFRATVEITYRFDFIA